MTIKLLTPYGTAKANAIVNLDSATESGLTTAKQATTDLTGGVPLVAAHPGLSRRRKGDRALRRRARTLLSAPIGMYTSNVDRTALGTSFTFHVERTLEAKIVAIQIGVINNSNGSTGAIAGAKLSFALSAIAGAANTSATIDPTLNGGAWVDCTSGGASSGTVAVGTSDYVHNVTFFDKMRVLDVPRTDGGIAARVLHMRLTLPPNVWIPRIEGTAAMAGLEQEGDASTAPFGRFYRNRTQAVDGIASKSAFTSTTTDNINHAPLIVRMWLADGSGQTWFLPGDSIQMGSGDTPANFGWGSRAQAMRSTADAPIEVFKAGRAGATPQQYSLICETMASIAGPSALAILPEGSPNGIGPTITATQLADQDLELARMVNACEANGIPYVISTQIPTDPSVKAFNATDNLRRVRTERTRAARDVYVDFQNDINGTVDANGQMNMDQAKQADHIHPGPLGYVSMATDWVAVDDLILTAD